MISNVDPGSTITFDSGTIEAVGADINNGAAFTVGDGGGTSATYRMVKGVKNMISQNGTHSFTNGLSLRANATLSGDGDIMGNVSGAPGPRYRLAPRRASSM